MLSDIKRKLQKIQTIERHSMLLDWQNIVKMAILPKFIFRFNAISNQILVPYFTSLEKTIQERICNYKKP